jgi:prepilin signal peptidase PulO-like enzyme (type II secretory pathway)
MLTVLLGIFVFLLAVIGASVGSFLNVVIWRVPEKMSLTSPPSHCPKCSSPVRWFDNVPVFSWFILRGKCRDCKEPISWRYPLVEASSCLVALVVSWALLFGSWVGWNSQAFFWEDYALWMSSNAETVDANRNFGDEQKNEQLENSSLAFLSSEDNFLALLRSTSALAITWLLVVDVALMLGFVGWDRSFSPKSLIFTSVVVLFIALLVVFLINDSDKCLERSGIFIGSAILGALGPVVCFPFLTSNIRLESAVLGAVWGVCSGYYFAFPGSLILCLLSHFLYKKINRQVFGLVVFYGTTTLLLLECVVMA